MDVSQPDSGPAEIQSLLFVPGSRPDRFAKALASGADCVCVDLEDAVAPEDKAAARDAAFEAAGEDRRVAVRINGLRTRAGLADLLALATASLRPSFLLVPMVEDAAELAIVRAILDDPTVALIPLIETVRGLSNAREIAADPAVWALMFGGADFAAELGVALAWEPLQAARSQLVLAAAGAGKGVIDVPHVVLDDADGLDAECARAKTLGMIGKAAIHPAQITAIHSAFRPTPAEIEEAGAAAAAWAEAGGGVVRFRGKMLEAPIMARYNKILALKDRLHA